MCIHLLEKGASQLYCHLLNLPQVFTQACRFVKKFPSHVIMGDVRQIISYSKAFGSFPSIEQSSILLFTSFA